MISIQNELVEIRNGQFFTAVGGFRAVMVCNQPCEVWCEQDGREWLLGVIHGQPEEIRVRLRGVFSVFFRTADDAALFCHNYLAEQLHDASDAKFTTLDRPAPMSPEMAAIQRLVRQNQLERDAFLLEQRALLDKIERAKDDDLVDGLPEGGEESGAKAKAKGGRKDKRPSEANPEGPGDDAGEVVSESDAEPET